MKEGRENMMTNEAREIRNWAMKNGGYWRGNTERETRDDNDGINDKKNQVRKWRRGNVRKRGKEEENVID